MNARHPVRSLAMWGLLALLAVALGGCPVGWHYPPHDGYHHDRQRMHDPDTMHGPGAAARPQRR